MPGNDKITTRQEDNHQKGNALQVDGKICHFSINRSILPPAVDLFNDDPFDLMSLFDGPESTIDQNGAGGEGRNRYGHKPECDNYSGLEMERLEQKIERNPERSSKAYQK